MSDDGIALSCYLKIRKIFHICKSCAKFLLFFFAYPYKYDFLQTKRIQQWLTRLHTDAIGLRYICVLTAMAWLHRTCSIFLKIKRMPTMGDAGTISAYDHHGRAQCDRTQHMTMGVIYPAMVARVVSTIFTTKRRLKKFNEISKIPKMSFFYRKKSDICLA